MSNDLYRHFDSDMNLLYVGISINSMVRLSQHRLSSGWYHEIAIVKVDKFESRKDAMNAEREAIIRERPRYNIIFNKDTGSLEIPVVQRAKDSRRYLLDSVVNSKLTYPVSELKNILSIGKPLIDKCIENGTLGSIVIGEIFNSRTGKYYKKRIVTGWQIIDFLEFMQNGGLDE